MGIRWHGAVMINRVLNGTEIATLRTFFGAKQGRVRWWRGLDSNQRTLARADLQSAAFNHSATSP